MLTRTPMRFRHSWLGAVLAEGIMAVVVSSLVLSTLPGFYVTYVKLWQRETGKIGAAQRADFALERMKDDVRNARRAVLSSDGTRLTLTLPQKAYSASLDRAVNALDAQGDLIDGDRVQYYFMQDPHGTGSSGGALYRRVVHADGSDEDPRLLTENIHPELNRLDSGGTPVPLFVCDSAARTVDVTVTAAEPRPTSSTFATSHFEPKCRVCGGDLVRVPTTEHPEGEIQCAQCGSEVKPTTEIVAYHTCRTLRNE